jgi:ABC-2 type transport system ATP-binding protein
MLSEVEQLCDRVAILNQGSLIYCGHWKELAPKGARFRIDAEPWGNVVAQLNGASIVEPGVIELPTGADVADLVTRLVQAGVKVRAVTPEKQTLEQLYLREVHK